MSPKDSPHPLGLFVTDLHLSDKAPIARSAEPDWMQVQLRELKFIRQVQIEHGSVPVFYGGDIFDKWNCSHALVNFAIDNLPSGWAIPGQHDLPWHVSEREDDSAYGTLLKCRTIRPLSSKTPAVFHKLAVLGFGWEQKLTPWKSHEEILKRKEYIKVALVHKFVWDPSSKVPGASHEGNSFVKLAEELRGFNVAIFGDNHTAFVNETVSPIIVNHGGFIRRNSDEVDKRPAVVVVMSDGSIKLVRRPKEMRRLDKFLPPDELKMLSVEVSPLFSSEEFLNGLKDLSSDSIDFKSFFSAFAKKHKISPGAFRVISSALSKSKS